MINSELYEFLAMMTQDERALSIAMSISQRVVFVTASVISALWGTFVKFFIYFNISREKFSERPINMLILYDQVVDHFMKMLLFFYAIAKVN